MIPGVRLLSPLFEVFRAKVGVSALPMWAREVYWCLHLLLQWDIVIHFGRVDVCCQEQSKGVWLLPLIEVL